MSLWPQWSAPKNSGLPAIAARSRGPRATSLQGCWTNALEAYTAKSNQGLGTHESYCHERYDVPASPPRCARRCLHVCPSQLGMGREGSRGDCVLKLVIEGRRSAAGQTDCLSTRAPWAPGANRLPRAGEQGWCLRPPAGGALPTLKREAGISDHFLRTTSRPAPANPTNLSSLGSWSCTWPQELLLPSHCLSPHRRSSRNHGRDCSPLLHQPEVSK